MTVDIEKLEALATACGDLNWRAIQENWCEWAIRDDQAYIAIMRTKSAKQSGPCSDREAKAKFLCAVTPAAVLEMIASGKRMAARLMYCPACQGEGEVYSGRNSYEGYNQPPEPIMNKCGECDGDGALGDTAECISILDELETLRAELSGLKTSYEAYERVNAALRAECEKLRKYAERYRWTSTEGNWVARFHGKWRAHVGGYGDAQPTDWYPSREEAIDAAMLKEQSHD